MAQDDDSDDEAAAPAAAPAAAADGEGAFDDDDDESDDPDAPVVVGKSTHKAEGKLFYEKMKKGDETISVGQDVYLENGMEVPYVARLQQIFVYSFAKKEIYFTARWYYREPDCHEYARMAGAKDDYEVTWGGEKLFAEPKELFFSLHLDENHADTILRACSVQLREADSAPAFEAFTNLGRHEFLAWRAYDNKKVYALNELPSKKLRDAFALERKRDGATSKPSLRERKKREEEDDDEDWDRELTNDDLRQLWLPRKHLEVWYDSNRFARVVDGILTRVSSILNGKRSFYVGKVVGVKRASRPYRLGKKDGKDRIAEYTLQVQTHLGTRLVGLDALSNEAPQDAELARFRVPLDPREVRQKLSALKREMENHSELFEEADIRRRQEAEERLAAKRHEEAKQRKLEAEERERRERERDEVRQRAAAQKAQDNDQWWLSYGNANDSGKKQRELAKWKARLKRFNTIATSSGAEGERENARRLAEQAQAKIDSLEEQQADADDAAADGDDEAEAPAAAEAMEEEAAAPAPAPAEEAAAMEEEAPAAAEEAPAPAEEEAPAAMEAEAPAAPPQPTEEDLFGADSD